MNLQTCPFRIAIMHLYVIQDMHKCTLPSWQYYQLLFDESYFNYAYKIKFCPDKQSCRKDI